MPKQNDNVPDDLVELVKLAESEPAPPVGSLAATAWLMSQTLPDDDFDWDQWKEEMKDALL